MTTYNTGNPIGSTDARDRSDNSENLDLAVNSLSQTFVDRLGRTRDTLEGVYQKSAYYRAGTFDAGYTLTNNRQTLAYGNIEYSWSGAFPKVVSAGATPATSGGIGAGAWVDRTDVTLRSELAGTGGAGLISTLSGRTQEEKNSDVISVKDWNPTIGVYGVDATADIVSADQWCYDNGKVLYFPSGQYCISSSITKKARWKGDGAPELAPFPQLDDDKIYLRPGYKHKLPGSSIILTSAASLSSVVTVRSDMFSSMTYAVKTAERYPASIDGIGIVMDMDVLDAGGNLTTPSTDNRVECDVGFLIDDASASDFPNLSVFGYWNKAGVCIWSHSVGDNPDYTKFGFGSTMGYYGLALIAHDTVAGNGPGLSGTQFFGFQLFGNDHHSRLPQTLRSGQTNAYGHLLFIDGNTGAVDADLNGHEFIGGGWRTYSNSPVVLDNCSSLHAINVPFEFPTIEGQADTGNQKFYGTANTRNVVVENCRNGTYQLFDHANFGDVISRLKFTDQTTGATFIGSGGAYVSIRAIGASGGPRIQFTRNLSSTLDGTSIVMDTTNGDKLKLKYGATVVATINGDTAEIVKCRSTMHSFERVVRTLSSDTLAVPTEVTYVQVAGEGGVADNLATIQGSPVIGQILILTQATSGAPITIKHGTGNIRFYNATDRVLDSIFKHLALIYNGVYWVALTF